MDPYSRTSDRHKGETVLQEIAAYIRQIEERLERLLASGWRNAAHEAQGFTTDADSLSALGLHTVAGRLREVAAAPDAMAALRAIVLATESCRLLRAHLVEAESLGPGAVQLHARRPRATDRISLLPLCRVAVDGEEVWSCLRSQGYAWEWLALDPLGDPAPQVPWLTMRVSGFPVWRGRYPVGAAAELTRVALSESAVSALAGDDGNLSVLRALQSGRIRSTQLPLWGGGYLRLDRLQAMPVAALRGLDDRFHAEDILDQHGDSAWGLVWDQLGERALVAAFAARADGMRVIHLVPGCPAEKIVPVP